MKPNKDFEADIGFFISGVDRNPGIGLYELNIMSKYHINLFGYSKPEIDNILEKIHLYERSKTKLSDEFCCGAFCGGVIGFLLTLLYIVFGLICCILGFEWLTNTIDSHLPNDSFSWCIIVSALIGGIFCVVCTIYDRKKFKRLVQSYYKTKNVSKSLQKN